MLHFSHFSFFPTMRFSCCIFSFPACDFRKTMAYYRETIHPIKFVERTIIMVRVACCWDDGMETDLRLIELLKKYHAKATFNLNPGLYYPDRRRTSGWQFPSYHAELESGSADP